ncbi:MAG TPA: HAMP domain-containing sensor histidine kinase [Polyangia bacterium]
MGSWIKSQWRAFGTSYDAPSAAVQSSPGVILLGPGLVILGVLALGYVPGLAARAGFRAPLVPVALLAVGALWTYLAWRNHATGRIGTAGMLLDTACYCSAFAWGAVLTSGWFAVAFAVAYALFTLGFPARVYSLTLPLALALAGPPLVAAVVAGTPSGPTAIMWAGAVIALVSCYRTGQHRALLAGNERLRTALGAADRVAEQSLDVALAAALVDVGSFLHELRNTRAACRANLQYLLESATLDDEGRAALEDAVQSQEQEDRLIAKVVADLRRKGRVVENRFRVQDVIDHFVREAPPPPEIRVVNDAPPFQVQGNPEHLQLVLLNLSRNAAQAGAGHLTLRVGSDASASSVVVEVEDDGPGLPEALRADPFQLFNSPGGEGLGLGLYLSRRYVEMMGGRIEVVPREGPGATFRLSMPGRLDAPGAQQEEQVPPAA